MKVYAEREELLISAYRAAIAAVCNVHGIVSNQTVDTVERLEAQIGADRSEILLQTARRREGMA